MSVNTVHHARNMTSISRPQVSSRGKPIRRAFGDAVAGFRMAAVGQRRFVAGTCPPRRAVVGQLTVAFRLFTPTAPTLPKAASTLTARRNRLTSSVFGKDGCDVLSFTK